MRAAVIRHRIIDDMGPVYSDNRSRFVFAGLCVHLAEEVFVQENDLTGSFALTVSPPKSICTYSKRICTKMADPMPGRKKSEDARAAGLYLLFQRVLRCLDFGRNLRGRHPAITISQMRILTFFNEQDVVHISEISHCLGMSLQSVNNIVSRLAHQGYVRRTRSVRDRRVCDISLTDTGRAGLDAFRADQVDMLSVLLEHLTDAEHERLQGSLDCVAVVLESAAQRIADSSPAAAGRARCG